MRLYLIRHGQALDPDVDPSRPLSEAGRNEALLLGAHLRGLSLEIPEVWHSGKTRAQQTASIVCEAAQIHTKLTEKPGLAPNDSPEPVAEEMAVRESDLCIVSHLPFLPALASLLTSGGRAEHPWAFVPCSMLCLEREGTGGAWWERWFVAPGALADPGTTSGC